MASCLDFLRGYLLIGCIFNVGLAVGAIVAGVFLSNLRKEFLVNDQADAVRKYVVIGLYVLGSICALTGLLGVLAFWKKIRCFQTLFIIFNTFFLIIFAALFAGLMIAQPYMNKLKNQDCNTISELKSANDLFVQQFKTQFCKKGQPLNLSCPCYVTDTSKWNANELSYLEFSSTIGIKTILDCKDPNVQSQIKSKQTEISLLQAVEEEFNCTGICEGDYIFYFSDLTRGPPSSTVEGCYKPLKDFLLKITGGVFIFVVIATVFTFLNVVIGFVNCCCQKSDNKEEEDKKNNNNNSLEMSVHKPLNPSHPLHNKFNKM